MTEQPAMRRRIGVGLIALFAALTTAACAAGKQAQTSHESPAIDGTSGTVGAINLLAVGIKAPSTGPSYPAGASVQVKLVIVSTGTTEDTLVGVTAAGTSGSALYANSTDAATAASSAASATQSAPSASASGSTSATASGSPSASVPSSPAIQTLTSLAVPAGGRVAVDINDGDKVLVLSGLTKPLSPGMTLPITFNFAKAGSITLSVPVQLADVGSSSPLVIPPGTAATG